MFPAPAGHTLYAASKAFVVKFSEALANEARAGGRWRTGDAHRAEATRSVSAPDREALASAARHAREACRLDPSSGEVVRSRPGSSSVSGQRRCDRRGPTGDDPLEPDNWRHHLRLAFVSWGEQRLGSAHRALKLFPGLALARWLAASVYIARQAFAEAEHELVAGAAEQDRQPGGTNAIGAVRLRHADPGEALAAFERAADIVTGHPAAVAARAAVTGDLSDKHTLDIRLRELRSLGGVAEAAFAEASYLSQPHVPHELARQRPSG